MNKITPAKMVSFALEAKESMKILLFGATGGAGGAVLRTILASPFISEVRAVVRRPLQIENQKLRVFVHSDFLDYTSVASAFQDVDSCLYCLGISVTQVSGEKEYRTITHDFALQAARMLKECSPDASFHFISGQGTRLDSRMMWARVKAETERDLVQLCNATCWRPAFIDGATSERVPRIYRVLKPLFRLLSPFRSLYVSGDDLGNAMLKAARSSRKGGMIENREIRELAV